MARRKKIVIDIKKLDIYNDIISELNQKNLLIDNKNTHIVISSMAIHTPVIAIDLNTLIGRLDRWIKINGNRRVSKSKLCSIMRISRPTLDSWVKNNFINLNYFCCSKELLYKWCYIVAFDLKNAFAGDNAVLIGELDGLLYDGHKAISEDDMNKYFHGLDRSLPYTEYHCSVCKIRPDNSKMDSCKYPKGSVELIAFCAKHNDEIGFWKDCALLEQHEDHIGIYYSIIKRIKYGRHYGSRPNINVYAFMAQLKKINNQLYNK